MSSFDTTNPIYLQLADQLCRQILRKELVPGDKLPAVREMAIRSKVNPNTVQRTYGELERMGVVESRRGLGSFITSNQERLDELREERKREEFQKFVRVMNEMGFEKDELLAGLEQFIKRKEDAE